jgi:hypothetical protein
MKKYKLLILLCFCVALTASCAEMVKDFGKMEELQNALSKKYKTGNININVRNGKYLTVSIINTPYNDSLSSVKQRITYEIGEIVFKVYKSDKKIEAGYVAFVTNNDYDIINTSSSTSFDMKLDSLAKTLKKDTLISK